MDEKDGMTSRPLARKEVLHAPREYGNLASLTSGDTGRLLVTFCVARRHWQYS